MEYLIQKSKDGKGWVCTDVEHNIVCSFENKKFNDTQQFTLLEDVEAPDPLSLAKIAREMGDWLRENHYDKIF